MREIWKSLEERSLKIWLKCRIHLKKHVFNLFLFSNYIFFLGKTGSLTQVLLGIERDVCFHSTSVLFPRVLFHGILKKLVNTRYSFRLRSWEYFYAWEDDNSITRDWKIQLTNRVKCIISSKRNENAWVHTPRFALFLLLMNISIQLHCTVVILQFKWGRYSWELCCF